MDNQNQTTPQKQRLHPLVATAAGAVIIASLAATAAVTGLFPKATSSDAQNGQTQAALIASQPAVDTAAAASAARAAQAQQIAAEQAAQQQQAQVAQAQPQPAPRPAPTHHRRHTSTAPRPPEYAQQGGGYSQPSSSYCQTCGTVVAINQMRTPGQSSGIGAVGGAAAGGLLGNQFGRGNGRTAMTLLGALGGGLAGNQVEKQVRAETDYQVQVQMENGTTRTFTYHNPPPFGQGQRVRIENGTLVGA
ncbi:glycine zipper 2TM domain-containing protein [Burkholderia multivorans]|uniref:glycine zipper 2TM domain-containing protein n=1 Tax=Burkholderia ubonensis TaxID=101571 RepID=UPI000F6EC626|nr:glycine zipper 2TM domain-containing protein [Burkholderia ubonensis]AYZ65680.1 glycine zipper 2TM domain-containing protein [Burkholderia multivorans]VWC31168.1 membrane protein [Burkholderia ubonensis]